MPAGTSIRRNDHALPMGGRSTRVGHESALVVSCRQSNRSILTHHLRQLGVMRVTHTGRTSDARRRLENESYDILILDEDVAEKGDDGQSLLAELRRCGLLDMQTIVLVTADAATHAQVALAAEAGVDAYLLRPFSFSAFHQRIYAAVQRRQAMASIYEAIKNKAWDDALQGCLIKIASKDAFWLYAARIAAEIYLLQGLPRQAQDLYEEIVRAEALPWAKLGIGRALAEQGRSVAALERLQQVLDEHPEQTDAYDIMGRIHMEQGNVEGALAAYQLAVVASPFSVSRVQRLGFAAFYGGQIDLAADMLGKSIAIGLRSRSFDPQAFFVMALIFNQKGLRVDSEKLLATLQRFRESPIHAGPRMERIGEEVQVIHWMTEGQTDAARSTTEHLTRQITQETYDFDSAYNLIALMALLAARGAAVNDDERIIEILGLRFAHSEHAASWLASAAQSHAPYAQKLHGSHQQVFRLVQQYVHLCVRKGPQHALAGLVECAQRHLNARMIEAAERLLQRHGANLDDRQDLAERIARLKIHNDPVRLRRNPGHRYLRHPGGLSLFKNLAAEDND